MRNEIHKPLFHFEVEFLSGVIFVPTLSHKCAVWRHKKKWEKPSWHLTMSSGDVGCWDDFKRIDFQAPTRLQRYAIWRLSRFRQTVKFCLGFLHRHNFLSHPQTLIVHTKNSFQLQKVECIVRRKMEKHFSIVAVLKEKEKLIQSSNCSTSWNSKLNENFPLETF